MGAEPHKPIRSSMNEVKLQLEKHTFLGLLNKACLHLEIISGELRVQYTLMSPYLSYIAEAPEASRYVRVIHALRAP